MQPRFFATRIGLLAATLGSASLVFELGYRASALHPADFRIFLDASHRLAAGSPLYQRGFISPPELAVILLPLTVVPLSVAYALFVTTSVVVLAWGASLYAVELSISRWVAVPALVLSPQGWWGLMLGQPDALLVGLLLLAVVAVRRQRWTLAGAIGPWLLLKPDITWLVVPMLVVSVWGDAHARGNLIRGVLLGLGAFVLLGGWLLPAWLVALPRFGASSQFQPILSGLADLLGGELSAAPAHQILASPLTWITAGIGLAATAAVFTCARSCTTDSSQLAEWMLLVPLAIWIATSPYVHAEDALFAFPLAVRLARSDQRWYHLPVVLFILPWVVFPTWAALSAVGTLGIAAAGVALMVGERRRVVVPSVTPM